MKILVTAFEPFGKRAINSSQEVLRRLKDSVDDWGIIKQLLPVNTLKAPVILKEILNNASYQAVVCLGEASSIRWVQLERLAVNWLDFPIADNAGKQVVDQKIAADGPAAYFSSLPVRQFEKLLYERGVPVKISMSAGTYLCNQVFYTLMHFLHGNKLDIPAGFIHLPVYSWKTSQDESDVHCGVSEYELIAEAVESMIGRLPHG